ncbi:putative cytochrome P450 oxidoreductase [Nemania abortiva]|nr:putative cytochrome P450 oxidoreductase [Nemania abortiva]
MEQASVAYLLGLLVLFWGSWGEPRELPYWIPVLGHGPAFFKSSSALLAKASNYFGTGTRDPFAITLFGSTMYVVTNPQHTVEVYRNEKTLSFDEFAQDLVRTNGYSEEAIKASYMNQPKEKLGFPNPRGVSFGVFVRQMHIHQLHPGENLRGIENRFVEWYESNLLLSAVQRLSPACKMNSGDVKISVTVPLMAWVSDYSTSAGAFAYFGDTLRSIDPSLTSIFIEFDDVSWQVLYQYPVLLSRKLTHTRKHMMRTFKEYLRIPQTQRNGCVWLLKAMEDEARAIGVGDDDIAVLYFNIYWLINTNTRKIAFWVLSYLLHRAPTLIELIRTEMGPAFRENHLVDLNHLYNSCPTLDNVWHESLRLCSNAASVRLIQEDTIIGGKLMRKGNRIMIPYRLLHLNEDIYGPEPNEFRPERFSDENGTFRSDITRGPSWRPFGGGKSLCTGRFIAKRATLIFIATVLHRFDIQLVREQGLPEADLGRPVLGIPGAKKEKSHLVKLTSR